MAEISWNDMTEKIPKSDWVYGEHFVSGIAAKPWVDTWIPCLRLGRYKFNDQTKKTEVNPKCRN